MKLLLAGISFMMFFDFSLTQSVTVKTKYGDIRGTVTVAPPVVESTITKVNQFKGIRFAQPPVGELRFKPPQRVQRAWKPKVYDATKFGKVCIQDPKFVNLLMKPISPNFGKANYSEDCLFLDVYAPAQNDSLNPTKHYPVMVYIHGGGFTVGTGIVTPGLILPLYGVIYVTIQYRLGPFGFLSTKNSAASGNYGMLDQVLALEWVKENIESFGGDPGKVTIFGLSAGGASVGLHLISPLSRNLFHGAISESGVDLSPWSAAKADVAADRAVLLAKKMGCAYDEDNELIECLRKQDAWKISNSAGLYWGPNIDSVLGDKAFLPDTPQNMRRAGKFKKVPYIVGFTPNEGAYFLPQLVNITVNIAYFKKSMEAYAAEGILPAKDKKLIDVITNGLEFQYTPWGDTSDPLKLRQGIFNVRSDEWFLAPSVQVCKVHSPLAPAYLFEFDYRSSISLNAKWMGATHGDNYVFDFGLPLLSVPGSPPFSATEKNLTKLVMTMYTNFAKTGNPTPKPLPNGVQWTAFNSSNHAYLHIDPSPEMRRNYRPHRMAFWNEYRPSLVESVPRCNATDKKPVNGAVRMVAPFMTFMFFISGTAILFV